MGSWNLTGIIILVALILLFTGVVFSQIQIDNVFIDSPVSGSQALQQTGISTYTNQSVSLLSLIWHAITGGLQ